MDWVMHFEGCRCHVEIQLLEIAVLGFRCFGSKVAVIRSDSVIGLALDKLSVSASGVMHHTLTFFLRRGNDVWRSLIVSRFSDEIFPVSEDFALGCAVVTRDGYAVGIGSEQFQRERERRSFRCVGVVSTR